MNDDGIATGALHEMTIDVERLLPALAGSLYGGNWRVAIRELLQNAQDAITQREFEDNGILPQNSERDRGVPRIRVIIDRARQVLIIEDTGLGLSLTDIHEKVARIGASGKDLERHSHDERRRLIGQFGLGFLAAFMVASEVTIYSRRSQPTNAQAVRASFPGRTQYTAGECEWSGGTGTRMELKLHPEFTRIQDSDQNLLNFQVVEDTIRHFGDLLPARITLHAGAHDETGVEVNQRLAPWEGEVTPRSLGEWLRRRKEPVGDFERAVPFFLSETQDGIEAHGVIYFAKNRNGFSMSSDRLPNILFVKRMYVSTGNSEMLPPWFRFAGVVVECPSLPLTLSRDRVMDVAHSPQYTRLQQRISERIVQAVEDWVRETGFRSWYSHNRDWFTDSLTRSYNPPGDKALFRAAAHAIPFQVRSSRFPNGTDMTLMEYEQAIANMSRKQFGDEEERVFLYLDYDLDRGRLRSIVMENPYPVLFVAGETQKGTLRAYASLEPGRRAVDVREVWDVSLGEQVDEERFRRLISLCVEVPSALSVSSVKVRSFRPDILPALIVSSDADPNQAAHIEQLLEQGGGHLSFRIRDMLRKQADNLRSGKASYTLYLNASNDLVQLLASRVDQGAGSAQRCERLVRLLVLNSGLPLFEDAMISEEYLRVYAAMAGQYLADSGEIEALKGERTQLQAALKTRLPREAALDISGVPGQPEMRVGAVLVANLDGVSWMLGRLGQRDVPELLAPIVDGLVDVIRPYGGRFDKFTGDGIIAEFFVGDPSSGDARMTTARNAQRCAVEILERIKRYFQRAESVEILQRLEVPAPECRIAITWGQMYFGRYGGAGTVVGAPLALATRLCGDETLFRSHAGAARIVITAEGYQELGRSPTQAANDRIRDWRADALAPTTIFRIDT